MVKKSKTLKKISKKKITGLHSNRKYAEKNTKIVCTIGPASNSLSVLQGLYDKGMDCVRINTAHGEISEFSKIIRLIKKNFDVPIMVDIKGPELRIRVPELIECRKGSLVEFWDKGNKLRFNYNMIPTLQKGDSILIEDGKFTFKVIEKKQNSIVAKAMQNSIIAPNKNVHLPEKNINLPSLTKKDKECIEMCKKEDVDYIALSFCRSKKDLTNLKKYIKNSDIRIISKIENHEGIKNINEIIDNSDGIMVARGDLGVEYPQSQVPVIQKNIIKNCNYKGKIVIVATEMLESMIYNPKPTRAEVSDIANAILDGADAIMLSAESAVGNFPVEAVEVMSKTAVATEPTVKPLYIKLDDKRNMTTSEAISFTVKGLCRELNFDKIVCLTYEGHSAQRVSRFRINKPIIALTSSDKLARQLMLYYGVYALHIKEDFWDPSTRQVLKDLYNLGVLKKNDFVLLTAGLYTLKEQSTNTNTIHIHHMKDLLEYFNKKGF